MFISETRTLFETKSANLQRLYNVAESKCRLNLRDFAGRRVLIEGGGYNKIWLETQPMGGEMYAGRDLTAALNNSLLFMELQRGDGRIPGSIENQPNGLAAQFNKFQGFFFAAPALNLYYWLGRDKAYLNQLYDCLARFDEYLWRVRDSDGDGCLESWCVTDTGEDGAVRYGDAPFWWTEDVPPTGYSVVPIASMDVTGFSVSARDTLADISNILQNGKADEWREKANDVRARIRSRLWIDDRGACFDRDRGGRIMPTLLHNNLRLMYWRCLSQGMAGRFVSEHLLNPDEFWTRAPLPSVAANDPLFRNNSGNDWSGQPEGLTYQRAIRALENYGYETLLAPIADRFFAAIGSDCIFTQQFDPFVGRRSGDIDGYGPSMLATLGYIEHLYGVHMEREELWWSARGGMECEFTLTIGDKTFALRGSGERYEGTINGRQVITAESGFRVVSDHNGNIIRRIRL
ncbi:MAG: hypothetical protein LBS72_02990 [Oscillospiraceae bacterium]|jgi:hypothetical protein|nr:hypothetical protein [Oscillospiraceae bacterium]